MLEEAKKRGVVEEVTNLFDEYWQNPDTAKACSLPYLEGDYWIGEAENIIKVCCFPCVLVFLSHLVFSDKPKRHQVFFCSEMQTATIICFCLVCFG